MHCAQYSVSVSVQSVCAGRRRNYSVAASVISHHGVQSPSNQKMPQWTTGANTRYAA